MSSTQQHKSVPKNKLVELYRQAVLSGVPLDKVDQKIDKATSRLTITAETEKSNSKDRAKKLQHSLPAVVRWGAALVPILFVGLGFMLLTTATWPVVQYYLIEAPQLQAQTLMAPIPTDDILDAAPVVIATTADDDHTAYAKESSGPIILDTELDYTNLNNWFDGQSPVLENTGSIAGVEGQTYKLDIPAVKITNAEVTIGGTDLNKSLIQYTGTALPGEPGAPVIFGHSVLRQFYNPSEKNARRYTSIFSYIMTLKKGDLIYLTYNNVKYTYKVEDKTQVKPTDVHILTQNHDNRRLKLVTCTPEGTYLMRGVVTAVLVPNE
jgi:LPXTG-site transpeptidase (sortase) family protein